jgi:3-deoxy-7-phosphoheptulonate synthase
VHCSVRSAHLDSKAYFNKAVLVTPSEWLTELKESAEVVELSSNSVRADPADGGIGESDTYFSVHGLRRGESDQACCVRALAEVCADGVEPDSNTTLGRSHPRQVDLPDAIRMVNIEPLVTPAELRAEIPASPAAMTTTQRARETIRRVLAGQDDRLVVITGPCSVHDPRAALVYAERLAGLAKDVENEVLVIMRVYPEKPRTQLGWKGLLSDPHLDGSHDLNRGLRLTRSLIAEITDSGLPIGCEFLDPFVPSYLADLVAWGSVGARTVQSQPHRQFTSGLPMPIGFKNVTSGEVSDAIDAIIAASQPHAFPSITDDGRAAVVTTAGNPDCHIILRGGRRGPNYSAVDVAASLDLLSQAGLRCSLVIDASHGNSGKDHRRQPYVVNSLARRIGLGEPGIAGIMLESFLVEGNQKLVLGRADQLTFGQSVTDACIDWNQTVRLIELLASAVDRRRAERPALVG